MSFEEDIDLRSREVQEVIGEPPGMMVRYGTVILLIFVVFIFYLAYSISYPETIRADIQVTSRELPRPIIAERSDYIAELRIPEEGMVQKDELILAFRSSAKAAHVISLSNSLSYVPDEDSILANFDIDESLKLGKLRPYVTHFREAQQTLAFEKEMSLRRTSSAQKGESRKRNKLRSDIRRLEKEVDKLEEDLRQASITLLNYQNRLKANQARFSDVSAAEQRKILLDRELARANSTLRDKKFELGLNRNRSGNDRSYYDAVATATLQLQEAFSELRNEVEKWKMDYAILSPISGQVVYVEPNLAAEQYVKQGDELMKVIPLKNTEPRGLMKVKAAGSGKIEPGQEVIVKFASYPFADYGAVIAEVESKGTVANEGYISVVINFPNDLRTTTGHHLDLKQVFDGTAEIILDRKRIIERLLETFSRAIR